MKINQLTIAAAIVFSLSTGAWSAKLPAKGTRAPELTFKELLQAPPNTHTEWSSLRGKVVVLDFWATWCAPCIAGIPHLNELSKSLANQNVVFIAVDDEDPDVVKKFLAKKPIAAWIGLDTDQRVFKAYGVVGRPATIVIDANGRVAANNLSKAITTAQLADLAQGKQVAFTEMKPHEGEKEVKSLMSFAAGKRTKDESSPVFELTIRPGNPKGEHLESVGHEDDGTLNGYFVIDQPTKSLIAFARNLPEDRVVIHGEAADKKWSVRLTGKRMEMERVRQMIETALIAGAGVKVTSERAEGDAFVLTAGAKTAELLTASASVNAMNFVVPDTHELMMVRGSMDDLVLDIEQIIGVPVLNETGLTGQYDETLEVPQHDVAGMTSVLQTKLGLDLVKSRRPVERVIVDPLPPVSVGREAAAAKDGAPKP